MVSSEYRYKFASPSSVIRYKELGVEHYSHPQYCSWCIAGPDETATLYVGGHGLYCYGGLVVAIGESWSSGQYYGAWVVVNGEKGFNAIPLGTISGISISKGSNGINIKSPNNTTYVYAMYIGRA